MNLSVSTSQEICGFLLDLESIKKKYEESLLSQNILIHTYDVDFFSELKDSQRQEMNGLHLHILEPGVLPSLL